MKNLAKLAKKQRELKEVYKNSKDPKVKELTLKTMKLIAGTLTFLIRSYTEKGLGNETESTEENMDN